MQPRPNPASKSGGDDVLVPYKLGVSTKLALRVYSASGKLEFETRIDAHAGEGEIDVPTSKLNSGAHYYELRAKDAMVRGQFVLTK